MKFFLSRARPVLAATLLAAAALLAGCGAKNAQESLASAKAYLAKNDVPAAIVELKNTLQAQPDLAEARFLLGRALLERDDAVGAVVELGKAVDARHPADQVVPVLARALLASGEGRKVIELDGITVLTTPEALADFNTSVARAHAAAGNVPKADAALADALRAKPDFAPALLLRARGQAGRGDGEAALKTVEGVLAAKPDDVDALALKGDLLLALNRDAAGATVAWKRALELEPDHVPAHAALVNQLLVSGKLDEAKAQIESLNKARPNQPQTAYFLARLASQRGDAKDADAMLQPLLKAAPDSPQVLQLAGVVALQRNDLLLAEQHFGKLLQLVPGASTARRLLAQVYLRNGEPAKALAVLQPLIDGTTTDAQALGMAGSAQMLAGNPKAAQELFARASQLNPADPRGRTALALSRVAQGQAEGVAELESIAGADSGTTADLALISTHLSRRDHAAALKAIDALDKKAPGKAQPQHLRATVLVAEGDAAGARAAWNKALAADPKFFPAIDMLAALDLREGKPAEARARFDKLLEANPDDTRAMVALANLDLREGKPPEQVQARLAKAVALRPADPSLRARLVQYHLGRRDNPAALNAAQDAAGAMPSDAEILNLLAGAQAAAGQQQQALASYNKLAALRPRAAAPLLGLADVQVAMKAWPDAQATLRKAAAVAPDSLAVLQRAVQVDVLAGQPEAAIAKSRALQAQAPKAGAGWLLDGDVE